MTEFPTFEGFLDELAATARTTRHVVGLVVFGSTAEGQRRDQWSDHDFAWVTEPGKDDEFRHDLSWLPHSDEIVLSVVEHHGGVKVIYRNGHRLEFGIADVEAFSLWAGAPARVIVGGEAVHSATAAVVARRPGGEVDAAREIRLMLTQVHGGVSRARRGEVLSGSGLVLGEAVDHLLRAAAARLTGDVARLDPLDPRRRFELVFPHFADRLGTALLLPPEDAAKEIVLLAEDELAPGWSEFPHAGLATVRERFGWV